MADCAKNNLTTTIVRFKHFGYRFFDLTPLIFNRFHSNLKYITDIKGLNTYINFKFFRLLKMVPTPGHFDFFALIAQIVNAKSYSSLHDLKHE